MKPNPHPIGSRRRFLQILATSSLIYVAGTKRTTAASDGKLRAAVIGHTGRGDYGHGLETIFAGQAGVELVALADPDPKGRATTAARIGAPRQYADYRELLAKEKPQLVSLAMRQADQHHAIALAALKAGAHVYCEKPFTTCPAESDELLAEATRRNRKIAVAHTMRLAPAVVKLQAAIQEGVIGDLVELRAYGKQDQRAGGEDMAVLGSHLFDLLRLFAGDPLWCNAQVLWQGRDLTAADARLTADNVGPVAGDQVFAQFGFAKGVQATFTSAAKLRETVGHWGIELHGSKGVARVNCDAVTRVLLRRTTGWQAARREEFWEPLEPTAPASAADHLLAPARDWLAAIAQDREPVCSGRNGAWAMEMVCAVYHAALQQRRVPFPLKDRTHPLAGPK